MDRLNSFKKKISYDSCVTYMANALLQSAKLNAYNIKKYIGVGPSLENLIERESCITPTPSQVT